MAITVRKYMGITVRKYIIPFETYFFLELPRGAKILTVLVEEGEPCIWAVIDPALRSKVRYNFHLLQEGYILAHNREDRDRASYIGSFQLVRGQLYRSYHLFEIGKKIKKK